MGCFQKSAALPGAWFTRGASRVASLRRSVDAASQWVRHALLRRATSDGARPIEVYYVTHDASYVKQFD